jgi:hypothetical protein
VKKTKPARSNRPAMKTENIDYSMSQLLCLPDLFSEESGSDSLSTASRSNEWLYVDPEYPETIPA